MITGGIIAALLMNSLVFPRHCHASQLTHALHHKLSLFQILFSNNVCGSLRMVSQLYMGLSRYGRFLSIFLY